jgi:hypothetical protein
MDCETCGRGSRRGRETRAEHGAARRTSGDPRGNAVKDFLIV